MHAFAKNNLKSQTQVVACKPDSTLFFFFFERDKTNVEICISSLALSKDFPVLFGLSFLLYLPPAHPTSCLFLCLIIPHSNKDLSTCLGI